MLYAVSRGKDADLMGQVQDGLAQRGVPGVAGVGGASDPTPDPRPGALGRAGGRGLAAPCWRRFRGGTLERDVLRGVARTLRGSRVEVGHGPAVQKLPRSRSPFYAPPDGLRLRRRPRIARRGAAAATVTYAALRARGVDRKAVGLAVAAVTGLVYGALFVLFSGSLLYMFVRGDLTPAETLITLVAAGALVAVFLAVYAVRARPQRARRMLEGAVYGVIRVVRRRYRREDAEELVKRLADRVGEETRSLRRQIGDRPFEGVWWCCLAFAYWACDAACLVLMFHALGVQAGTAELLVAYGIVTAAGTLPLTPGGIGVFEATMLATLAVFGIGAGAAVPVLGYRLFNFWLPIPLYVILYPSLRKSGRGERLR